MLTGYVDEKRKRGGGGEERWEGEDVRRGLRERGKWRKEGGGREGGGRGTMGYLELKSTNGAVVRPPAVY